MMVRAGLTTATVAWGAALPLAAPHDPGGAVAGFGLAWVGSMLPDLDHRSSTAGRLLGRRTQWLLNRLAGGHRMGTHSLPGVFLCWLLTGYLLSGPHGPTLANALAVGILAHMFTDMLTVDGIAWLYPLGWPFQALAWLLKSLGVARRFARMCRRFGDLLNAKTKIGWINTDSRQEQLYVFGMKCVGIAVACLYLVIWVPRATDAVTVWIQTHPVGGIS